MTFQDKAKQAAEEHNFYEDPGKKLGFRHGFIAGSAWARDQTLEDLKLRYVPDRCLDITVRDEQTIKAKGLGFQETLEMLRSKAGAEYFADTGDVLTNQGVADWLQEQRKRGER